MWRRMHESESSQKRCHKQSSQREMHHRRLGCLANSPAPVLVLRRLGGHRAVVVANLFDLAVSDVHHLSPERFDNFSFLWASSNGTGRLQLPARQKCGSATGMLILSYSFLYGTPLHEGCQASLGNHA
jgi:hypothetical protein